MESWKERAERLFFEKGLRIGVVSEKVGISRQSVSNHLKCQPGFEAEIIRRKNVNKVKRKEYQRKWDKENRSGRYTSVSQDTMRREHDIAALILSHEKY